MSLHPDTEDRLNNALNLLKKTKLAVSELASHSDGKELKTELSYMHRDLDEMFCELQELFNFDEEIEPDDFTLNDE